MIGDIVDITGDQLSSIHNLVDNSLVKLYKLFGVRQARELLFIARFYAKNPTDEQSIDRSLNIYPLTENESREAIVKQAIGVSKARYSGDFSGCHLIIFNEHGVPRKPWVRSGEPEPEFNPEWAYHFTLTREAVYAVLQDKPTPALSTEELPQRYGLSWRNLPDPDIPTYMAKVNRQDLEGLAKGIGSESEELLKHTINYPVFDNGLYVDTRSFFVPLGQSEVARAYERIDWYKELKQVQPKQDQKFYDLQEKASLLVARLPHAAGSMLLDQNSGSAYHVKEQHGDAFNCSPQKLWDSYCLPMLRDGRVD